MEELKLEGAGMEESGREGMGIEEPGREGMGMEETRIKGAGMKEPGREGMGMEEPGREGMRMEGTGMEALGMEAPRIEQPREIELVAELRSVRKHISKLGWMYVVGTIVIYAAQLIAMFLVEWFKPEWLENANIAMVVSMLPMYLIGMPILYLAVRTVPASVPKRHKMKAGHFAVAALMCFSLIYIFNIVGNIITSIISFFKGGMVDNQLLDLTSSLDLWMTFILTVICAPVIEEFMFRKLIVDRMLFFGQGTAVVISGLMFGLFHGNLNQFAYATALGIFLAFLYAKTGNLKITIALHMMVNFVGGVISTWMLRIIDLDEYLRVAEQGMEAMMDYFMDNLGGWIAYLIYMIFIFGVMIAGFVLLIVCMAKKKFRLNKGKAVIPKKERFRTVILNMGMGVYCVIWIGTIILQLFM